MKRKDSGRERAEIGLPRITVDYTQTREQGAALAEQEPERINWAERILGLPWIWFNYRGAGVKVAVLDTGVDTDHPDLVSAISDTQDFTGEGIEDRNGHGTHCAGIIAARLNDFGFVGVAPESRLLIGKVLNRDGSGTFRQIANGINWAVSRDADIISMSLGAMASTDDLFTAIHNALAKGAFVICAAGNAGSLFENSIGFPGRYGGVITVASHDEDGNVSGFSSRGGEIDCLGPGSHIFSTYLDGGFAVISGTSMAAPFVAGLAALIVDKHKRTPENATPLGNNEDLKEHLLRMATHPGYHDPARGYGVLQPFQYFY